MNSPAHSLTNLDISENYCDVELILCRKDFLGPFANWVVRQSPYDVPDIAAALVAFDGFIREVMDFTLAGDSFKRFTYAELSDLLTEQTLEKIPAILALNVAKKGKADVVFVTRYSQPHPDYDFIDLGALARNVFYDIIRNHVNWAE